MREFLHAAIANNYPIHRLYASNRMHSRCIETLDVIFSRNTQTLDESRTHGSVTWHKHTDIDYFDNDISFMSATHIIIIIKRGILYIYIWKYYIYKNVQWNLIKKEQHFSQTLKSSFNIFINRYIGLKFW